MHRHREQSTFPFQSPVHEILADERWYGDGDPSWAGAPTSEQAEERRLFCAKRLRRFKLSPQALNLAARLKACRPGKRCKSGACPECGRAFQRWFVHSTTALISASGSSGDLVSVSIVFPKARVPSSGITGLSMTESTAAVTEALQDSTDIEWIVGGIDVSLNDDTQKGLGEDWQLQLYAIAMVKNRDALASRLRSKFERTKEVFRPVQIKLCDGSARVISYAYKAEFVRRIAYHATITSKGKSRRCWMTRKVSLRARDHANLMEWLDAVGLSQRLYLHGVHATTTSTGVALEKVKLLE
jgi:hypothetical protein